MYNPSRPECRGLYPKIETLIMQKNMIPACCFLNGRDITLLPGPARTFSAEMSAARDEIVNRARKQAREARERSAAS